MDYTSMFSLKGKVIVVTGGTGILGKAFVDGIIASGGIAVVVGRNETEGNKRVNEILSNGGEALFVQTDVLNEKQVEALRDKVMESEGIDVSQIRLIHNGSQLNFTQTFDKTKINGGDTIHLVLALRGG